jgi:hypothetical protein
MVTGVARDDDEYLQLKIAAVEKVNQDNALEFLELTKSQLIDKLRVLDLDNITEVEDLYLIAAQLTQAACYKVAIDKATRKEITVDEALESVGTDDMISVITEVFQGHPELALLSKFLEIDKKYCPTKEIWAGLHARMALMAATLLIKWEYLGSGQFNDVYVDSDRKALFKVQKPEQEQDHPGMDVLDETNLCIRVWNEVNSHLKPRAFAVSYGIKGEVMSGWRVPFIEPAVEPVTDEEIAQLLVETFNRTGQIIIDAVAPGSVIKNKATGRLVCVNIDQTVQFSKREEGLISDFCDRGGEPDCEGACKTLSESQQEYQQILDSCTTSEDSYPQATKVLKSLLFIKENRTDIVKATFLLESPVSDTTIASGLGKRDTDEAHQTAMMELQDLVPLDFEQLKQSSITHLQRYINSRGTCTDSLFEPNPITKFFRDARLTKQKVLSAAALITAIESSSSIAEINELIKERLRNNSLTKGTFTSGFEKALYACHENCKLGEKHNITATTSLDNMC